MIKIKKQPLSLEQQSQEYYGVKEHKVFGEQNNLWLGMEPAQESLSRTSYEGTH